MAEKGLSLRVILELIDKMSGPLQKAAINVEGLTKGLKASMATAKSLAPIIGAAYGVHEAGKKANEAIAGASESAEPLAEAKTLYEQLAGSQSLATATAQALKLTRDYGVASWDQELTLIARAYQLYGNYGDAVKAATAANRLALGTHADAAETLERLAITSRNAGVSTDLMADKLAKLYQVAGAGGEGAASNAQLQKAFGLARSQGVSLDKFLAIAAVAERSGLRPRDLESYFMPRSAGKRGSGGARAEAVRDLINQNGADIDRFTKMLQASADASAKLADAAGEDAAHQVERSNLVSEALKQAAGAPALEATGKLDQLKAAIEGMTASAILAHPKLAVIGVDLSAIGGQVMSKGGSAVTWGTSGYGLLSLLRNARTWWGKGAAGAGEAAAGAGEAAEGAAAAGGAGLLGSLATFGGVAGLIAATVPAAINYLESHPSNITKGILAGVFGGVDSSKAPKPPVNHSTSIAVTPGPVTITVNVPSGTSHEQAKEIAEAMKAALELHDPELARKLAEAVSAEAKKNARTEFDGGW